MSRAGTLLAACLLALLCGEMRAACLALEGGSIVLPGAKPSPGTIVLRDERIAEVGAAAAVPPDCRRVAITGKTVTAGLIDASTAMGVEEIDLEPSTLDVDAGGTDPVRAAFRVADGYDPRSALVPVARLGGVTSVVVIPSGGKVSGQAAWADLLGATQAEAVRRAPLAIAVDLASASGATLRLLRELLEDTRRFSARRDAWERGESRAFAWSRLDLEALGPVVERKIPLVVAVDRASDIEALLRFASEEQVRVVIHGGAEAHLVAPALARAGVGVIMDPLVYGPGGFDQLRARRGSAALLARAGVAVAFSTSSPHNARRLRQLAGNAVRDGLPWEAGLDAITAAPARLYGMEGYGVLAAGAVANVAVWSGDPLESGSSLEQLYVHGVSVPLRSRQSELFERYRKLPGTPPAVLPLP